MDLVPQVDFSPLGQLGQRYDQGRAAAEAARIRQGRMQTLAGLGQDGAPDYAAAAGKLMGLGDLEGATILSRLAQQQRSDQFGQQKFDWQRQNADREFGLHQQKLQAAGRDPTELRRAWATQNGLAADDPRYQSFVLTGKFPREDQASLTATDRKAILEADEAVAQTRATIDQLGEAKQISPQTYQGFGAGLRTQLGTKLPDWLVPNFVASPRPAAAGANYENLVLGQALSSLKSIFGAAPTEGERKILLDLQASLDKPDNVRQEILDRAQRLANARLQFNEQRARELRGGQYYKAGGGASQAAPQQATPTPQRGNGQQPRLEPGVSVINGFRYRGGPPNDQASWEPAQ